MDTKSLHDVNTMAALFIVNIDIKGNYFTMIIISFSFIIDDDCR